MTTDTLETVPTENWKPKILVIGSLIGAIIGLGTAYLLVSRAEGEEKLDLTPAQGVKMGLAALTFLRQITQMGE